MEEIASGIIGIGAVATSTIFYLQSRQALQAAQRNAHSHPTTTSGRTEITNHKDT